MIHHNHFTIYDRICIADLLDKSNSIRQIAKILGKSPSSVSREIKRNSNGGVYSPVKAQTYATFRKTNRPTNNKFHNSILLKVLNSCLQRNWSPEQIVNRCKIKNIPIDMVSVTTTYRWINKGLLKMQPKELRHKGKRQKHDNRGKFVCGTSIAERPQEVNDRLYIGDYEGDTVVSSRGQSKSCIATFVDRKSGYLIARLLPDRTAKHMAEAIMEAFDGKKIRTLTVDRGKEFACYQKIEKALGIKVYFTDAYCAWQKGTVENTNGLLRQYFPKKFNFNEITQEELDKVVDEINNRPRKRLGYLTPKEFIAKCCI